ncbi:5-formyltetrahydrofolate cyclo-ligase [Bartonella sp. LJL80]
MKKDKNALRVECLARRDAMDPEQRLKIAGQMAENVDDAIRIMTGKVVSGFWPIRSEIDPRPVMMALHKHGFQLALPALIDKTTMVFRSFENESQLVPMGFGTFGPGQDSVMVEPDCLLVPLASFDKNGNRIGYGAGYYDRAIAQMHRNGRNPLLIGFAFDCQQVEHIPAEPHDIPLDRIWTESGLRIL